jgi:hypothetical protein
MNDDRTTRLDRMRYTKNTASSRLALLAIVFDVLFFISLYKSDVDTYYYKAIIGGSIIYNLVFMLAAFLCSEGVKRYQKVYSWVLIVLGAIQVARIFILPMDAHRTMISGAPVMGDAQFIFVVICLALSAVCLLAAAAVNLKKCRELSAHLASLQA